MVSSRKDKNPPLNKGRRGGVRVNKNSGFNIIELVVVVVIIGILSALAIPQYNKTVERSRQTEALTNLAAIRGAQTRLYLEKATYTENFADLDIDDPAATNGYFDYNAVNSTTATGIIASAVRRYGAGNKNPGFGNYDITIDSSGATVKNTGTSGCSGTCPAPP